MFTGLGSSFDERLPLLSDEFKPLVAQVSVTANVEFSLHNGDRKWRVNLARDQAKPVIVIGDESGSPLVAKEANVNPYFLGVHARC